MIRNFSQRFVNYIANNNYTEKEIEQMEYVFRVFLFEILKLMGVLILFSLLGCFKECIIAELTMCLISPYIGGYHEETQLKCFITTVIFTGISIFLNKQCSMSFMANVILIIICIFCIYQQAPIINPKMPITRPKLIEKNRKRGLFNSTFLGVLAIISYNYTSYYSLITWTIIIKVILMFNKKKN